MKIRYALILCAFLASSLPLAAGAEEQAPACDARATGIHTVEPGETLTSIARLYGMSVGELKRTNHVRRPKRLKPGMRLVVRNADPEAEAPAAEPPPPATKSRQSILARELKELAASPVVREVRELSDPTGAESVVGGIKDKLILIARKMLDIPYRFGGSSILGIDCSGYVQKVFGLMDIVLPRTAREQFGLGKLVDREELSIGDLVFFRTYAKFPSHVGIYLGDNQFIHASSKDRKVTIDSLDAPYYLKRFIGARRLVPEDDPGKEI